MGKPTHLIPMIIAGVVDVSSSVFSVPGPFDFLCAHAMTCTFPSPSPA